MVRADLPANAHAYRQIVHMPDRTHEHVVILHFGVKFETPFDLKGDAGSGIHTWLDHGIRQGDPAGRVPGSIKSEKGIVPGRVRDGGSSQLLGALIEPSAAGGVNVPSPFGMEMPDRLEREGPRIDVASRKSVGQPQVTQRGLGDGERVILGFDHRAKARGEVVTHAALNIGAIVNVLGGVENRLRQSAAEVEGKPVECLSAQPGRDETDIKRRDYFQMKQTPLAIWLMER
jgi:hypothetical protein